MCCFDIGCGRRAGNSRWRTIGHLHPLWPRPLFEGTVYLGDQPLQPRFGKYPTIAEGSELRTAKGRAEVLLTPGVFLRLGEGSSIRMVASALGHTRWIAGRIRSCGVGEPGSGTSVTLIYTDWNVHFRHKGIYRIDAEPPRLWVQQGAAEVSSGDTGSRYPWNRECTCRLPRSSCRKALSVCSETRSPIGPKGGANRFRGQRHHRPD